MQNGRKKQLVAYSTALCCRCHLMRATLNPTARQHLSQVSKMKMTSTLLTSLLFDTLIMTTRVNGEVTPCFIPLPELAFTDSIETWTSVTAIATSGETAAKASGSAQVTTTIETTDEASDSTQLAWSSEVSGDSNTTTHVATSSESAEETSTSTQLATTNETANEIANYPGNRTASESISETASEALGETNATSTPIPTEHVTICVPYCAALDKNDRCVSIKGCRYPNGGNFGRHGCCPPGYYSESEVVGLVTLATLIIVIILCTRG